MRKGTDLIGKPIIAYDTGRKLATVQDLIFNQNQGALVALLTEEPNWFSAGKIIAVSEIKAIGIDGILVHSENAIVPVKQVPAVHELLNHNNILRGTEIMTVSGRNLGKMVDLYFDGYTGVVEGYEVSGGLFSDAYTGRSFVPTTDTVRIGYDFAFVPDSVVGLMEEQVGGIKAVMIATGNKAQDLAQQASHKTQELSAVAAEKLGEAQGQALSAITDAVVTPEQQKHFALGRTVDSNIYDSTGVIVVQKNQLVMQSDVERAEAFGVLDALYRATGGDVVAETKQKIGQKAGELSQSASETFDRVADKTRNAVAGYAVDETLGRRVNTMVYSRDGEIIAATGQIVTGRILELAKESHQEKALLNATGLSEQAVAKRQTKVLAHQAGSQARQISNQVQYGTVSALEWVKQTADELYGKSSSAIMDQRIKGALGRPVNRVILDQNDSVILNVGELVTHRAIAEARQADVLDILLGSIHDAPPQIPSYEIKAPQSGRASLV